MSINRKLVAGILVILLISVVSVILAYDLLFGKKIRIGAEAVIIDIPEGASYSEVLDSIYSNIKVDHTKVFEWVAEKKKYPQLIKQGRYRIDGDLSYTGLINLLRSGRQSPVNVTFNNIRTIYDLAGRVGGRIAADSSEIADFLSDPSNYSGDGFSRETIISVFIPDTYQFFWNTDARGFYERMLKEYKKFWNEVRLAKAGALKLSPTEVSILASIVDDEVLKAEEKPRIAGVYLNRLRRGIALQACPTIKFAMNDFTITRVLKVHLQFESPYNTYKYKGFPPGPIGCPSQEGIDAVLNAEKHDYLFFVAKADFSGYHNFSRTLSEHNRFAAEYQRELNKRKIFR
jgi:UPF0755 protein